MAARRASATKSGSAITGVGLAGSNPFAPTTPHIRADGVISGEATHSRYATGRCSTRPRVLGDPYGGAR